MKKQHLIAMVISMIFLLTGCLHNNGKGNIRIESEEEQTGILDEGTLDQCLRVYQSIYDDAGNDITIWHVQNNCRRLFRVKNRQRMQTVLYFVLPWIRSFGYIVFCHVGKK